MRFHLETTSGCHFATTWPCFPWQFFQTLSRPSLVGLGDLTKRRRPSFRPVSIFRMGLARSSSASHALTLNCGILGWSRWVLGQHPEAYRRLWSYASLLACAFLACQIFGLQSLSSSLKLPTGSESCWWNSNKLMITSQYHTYAKSKPLWDWNRTVPLTSTHVKTLLNQNANPRPEEIQCWSHGNFASEIDAPNHPTTGQIFFRPFQNYHDSLSIENCLLAFQAKENRLAVSIITHQT